MIEIEGSKTRKRLLTDVRDREVNPQFPESVPTNVHGVSKKTHGSSHLKIFQEKSNVYGQEKTIRNRH